jgi:hypothetical protein
VRTEAEFNERVAKPVQQETIDTAPEGRLSREAGGSDAASGWPEFLCKLIGEYVGEQLAEQHEECQAAR